MHDWWLKSIRYFLFVRTLRLDNHLLELPGHFTSYLLSTNCSFPLKILLSSWNHIPHVFSARVIRLSPLVRAEKYDAWALAIISCRHCSCCGAARRPTPVLCFKLADCCHQRSFLHANRPNWNSIMESNNRVHLSSTFCNQCA